MTAQLLFIGTTELLLIGGIALLLFGGKKLPEMMKGLGQGVKSFKQGMNEPIADERADDVASGDNGIGGGSASEVDTTPQQPSAHGDGQKE